jgi:hypothetical protein
VNHPGDTYTFSISSAAISMPPSSLHVRASRRSRLSRFGSATTRTTGSKNRGQISLMRRHRHNLKPEQQVRLLSYLADLRL